MQTTHTPGPWIVDLDNLVQYATIRRAQDQEVIAIIEYVDNDAAKANAHLCAAAPDLLAALRALERGIRLWASEGVADADFRTARALLARIDSAT